VMDEKTAQGLKFLVLFLRIDLQCSQASAVTASAIPARSPPRALSRGRQQEVVRGLTTRSGLKIFRRDRGPPAPIENVFISPTSISMALGMTLNAPREPPRRQ